jgi:hypothetical protein
LPPLNRRVPRVRCSNAGEGPPWRTRKAQADANAMPRFARWSLGVFRAEYRGELTPEIPDAREFPGYHVGTSVADVKICMGSR